MKTGACTPGFPFILVTKLCLVTHLQLKLCFKTIYCEEITYKCVPKQSLGTRVKHPRLGLYKETHLSPRFQRGAKYSRVQLQKLKVLVGQAS